MASRIGTKIGPGSSSLVLWTGAGCCVWAQPVGGRLGSSTLRHGYLKLEWTVRGGSKFRITGGVSVLAGGLLGGPRREDTKRLGLDDPRVPSRVSAALQSPWLLPSLCSGFKAQRCFPKRHCHHGPDTLEPWAGQAY